MWQTVIIFAIALAFKAAAFYAEKKKKAEEQARRERAQSARATPQPKAWSAPAAVSVRIPIAPPPAPAPALAPKAAQSVHPLFDSIVEALRSHTPQKTSELHSSEEGEATAGQLAKTVEMIHSGVLRGSRDHKPVASGRRVIKPVGNTGCTIPGVAGTSVRGKHRHDWRRAVIAAEILGKPRSLA